MFDFKPTFAHKHTPVAQRFSNRKSGVKAVMLNLSALAMVLEDTPDVLVVLALDGER